MKELSSQEVLKRTKELFLEIDSLQSDEEKLPLRTEIFKLNHRIISNELAKRANLYDKLFTSVRDDLYGAVCEALWIAILKYNSSKNANLYTFATPYIKEQCGNVVRSAVTKDTLSDYEFKQYLKMKTMIENGYSRQDLIDSKEFGKTDMAVNRMFNVAAGGVFPPENEAVLLGFSKRENGYRKLEVSEWISQLRELVVKDEFDEYLFNAIVKGTSKNSKTMASLFNTTRPVCEAKADEFYKRLREAYDALEEGSAGSGKEAEINFIPGGVATVCDSDVLDISDIEKGGRGVKVPEEIRSAAITTKIDVSIDLGVKKYIDERVEEKIYQMSVEEITQYVVDSLNNRK